MFLIFIVTRLVYLLCSEIQHGTRPIRIESGTLFIDVSLHTGTVA